MSSFFSTLKKIKAGRKLETGSTWNPLTNPLISQHWITFDRLFSAVNDNTMFVLLMVWRVDAGQSVTICSFPMLCLAATVQLSQMPLLIDLCVMVCLKGTLNERHIE